jgi:excisionase family DNA binding protein
VVTRSRSGQHEKVQRARAVVAQALGDAARRDQLQVRKFAAIAKPGERVEVKMEAIPVLTISEAATRLGITKDELEAMVKRGTVKSLMAGWTVVVPTSEVERLRRSEPQPGR